MYTKRIYNDPAVGGMTTDPIRLILHEISSCVQAGRHTGIQQYGPNAPSGLIPSRDPPPAGLVARVFSTNSSSYIETKADQGSGVA